MTNEKKVESCDEESCKNEVVGGLFYLLAQEEERVRKEKENKKNNKE